MGEKTKEKNQQIENLLCGFLGFTGAHRFYTGRIKSGILYLFTFGLFGIGWIVDGIRLQIRFQKQKQTSSVNSTNNEFTIEKFYVAGVQYYTDNINKLAVRNPDWKMTAAQLTKAGKDKVFRYNYINKPAKLIPEPQNKHDRNAIMVMVAGEKVGYISQEDNVHVLQILKKCKIKFISSFIGGGQYKIVLEDGSMSHLENDLKISIKIGYSK